MITDVGTAQVLIIETLEWRVKATMFELELMLSSFDVDIGDAIGRLLLDNPWIGHEAVGDDLYYFMKDTL